MTWIFVLLENSTSWADLLEFGLKNVFQLLAHEEIDWRSLFRIVAFPILSLKTVKRDVLSGKIWTLDFNSLGKSLI